jgi:hypothetical protein
VTGCGGCLEGKEDYEKGLSKSLALRSLIGTNRRLQVSLAVWCAEIEARNACFAYQLDL